jgi:scyllo-inositol 2-dehydrogenase (NADP+)
MKTAKIRIGVSGLGRIGWPFHCAEIARHPQYEFVAVQDPERGRRDEAEKVYGVRSFESFADMLAEGRLDAVAIATPTHLHRPMAVAALAAGCHVMLEKPMAPDHADALAIVREARRRGRVLTVFQPRRAEAYFQHLKALAASGLIGDVYHVRIGGFGYTMRDDWQALRRFGGGMLNNHGAHALDQLLQLVGYRIRRLFCSLRLVASAGDAEDVVKVVVETASGVIGEIDINSASAINPGFFDVWGTRGAISLPPGDTTTFRVKSFPAGALAPHRLNPDLASADRKYPDALDPFRESTIPVDAKLRVDVYDDLARAIRTGAKPFVVPEEPLAVMKLIERCRAEAGRIVQTRLHPRGGR